VSRSWEPPAPGSWQFDVTHSTGPAGRAFDDVYLDGYSAGFAAGFEAVGAPLKTLRIASIHGWHFVSPELLGGPPDPKGPPPKLLMTVLFALVPTLRARKRRATTLFDERPWRQAWQQFEDFDAPRLSRRIDTLARSDVSGASDETLAEHVTQASELNRELCRLHFQNAPFSAVAVGDYLVHSGRWAGAPAVESSLALAGFSAATSRPLRQLDAVVQALDADGALEALRHDPKTVRERIHAASSRAGEALDDYLHEYGPLPISGLTLYDTTLAERPAVWVGSLRQRAKGGGGSATSAAAERVAEKLRERVPSAHRASWDEMLRDAREGSARRELDVHLFLRGLGVLRRALLEVGQRLVTMGLAEVRESALDLTIDEGLQALRGGGPNREAIAAHSAERQRQAQLSPPPYVGSEPQPPPFDRFPAAVRRVTEASFAFTSRFTAEADPIRQPGLAGLPVSGGVVEGIARVLHGPADFERVCEGEILLAKTTSPSFNVVLALAAGLVTEVGGLICHAAIVAREFGIPGVVGCAGVLDQVPDGARIRVDGDSGVVEVLSIEPSIEPSMEPSVEPSAAHAEAAEGSPVAAPQVSDEPGRIVGLADARDRSTFGGKASNLGALLHGGIPSPDGIALDATFAEAVAAEDGSHIARLDEALVKLPGPWAVRSSATCEDGSRASFAGQFDTVLGVTSSQECVRAIQQVWRSAQSPGVRAYCERLGIEERPRMAVVIQQLVDAEIAGVLFAPVDDDRIVEAVWGLGEPLVSGTIDPDRFRISPSGAVRTREVTPKTTELRRRADGHTEHCPVPDERVDRACLTDEQLAALSELANRCRDVFGGGQDIEWAWSKRGLLCLQARPITVAAV
jgi:rifampicin phosphotransferase